MTMTLRGTVHGKTIELEDGGRGRSGPRSRWCYSQNSTLRNGVKVCDGRQAHGQIYRKRKILRRGITSDPLKHYGKETS